MKKRVFAFVILLSTLIFSCTAVSAATYSGNCGDNVKWEYTASGELKITGNGAMTDYASASEVPWSGLRNIIYSISVSNGVTSVGDYAFANCWYVTSATLADTVKSIGDYAFSICEVMTEVNMPSSLTSIGKGAFESCRYVTSISIPAGVTSIGDKAFYCCLDLTGINVDANNQYYSSDNGVLYDKQKQTLMLYPIAKTDAVYTIPNTTTSIVDYAFYECDNITSVIMGENVESIGSRAFYGCSKLANVTMSSKLTSIGEYAFYYSLLETVTIPEGVTSIETNTFAYCHKLTSVTLPDSITSISTRAFFDCDALTSITIPENVTSIGTFAFYYCEALEEINWNAKNVNDLGNQDGIFAHAGVQGDGITLTIGESVERIPAYAFSPEYSPRYPNITEVIFGKNLTEIGEGAFCDCSSLTTITIPDNVTTIGTYAFTSCEGLTDVVIGKGVQSIGTSAFSNCKSLSNITVDENNQYYTSKDSVIFDKEMKKLIMYPIGKTDVSYQVPNGVTSIADRAFYCSEILASITIPNTLESIGSYAFYRCSNISNVYYANGEVEWNQITVESGNTDLTNATRHYNYSSGVTGGGRPPVEATVAVDSEGNAVITLEFVDEALTADSVMVFAAGFSNGKLASVADLEKTQTDSGVKYSGKVGDGSKLFIWSKSLAPLTQPMDINY